ncbi:integrase, catalytic region, zinc finger, CCHC-type containing protein [Tanacetum coccineum]
MSTQQDIYTTDSKNRPLMLNKENYVPWSSRLLWYAKSRTNGKLIYNSIMNHPYVRRMIPEPGDADSEVTVNETFHEQTDDELTEKELKQVEADDQAIQTILLSLLEDIYAAVDSCETAQEIWLRVQQMMKGFDIGIQEKKAMLFNEWERFTSIDGESIESYYHRFSKMESTCYHCSSNKGLHTTDYTQLYDFLKYNQKEVDDLRAKRLAKIHDPLALMNVGNQNGLIVVPGIANHNPNRNGNVVAARAEGNAIRNNGNQIRCYNCRGLGHLARNCIVKPRRRDAAYLQTQLLIAQKEEAGIQLQAKEFDLMAVAADLDEIEEVNANYILMENLQQESTSEEQYTELLEPIPEPHQVQQNDSNVIYEVSSVEQDGGPVDQHPTAVEETRAYFESLYNNLAIEVEKLSKEKSTVSSLLEEKKKLKSDFKIREDKLLVKQIQLENKIKELDNILVKMGQLIQTIHMLSPKPDSFYHTDS